jgi:hypothetical protein
MLAAAISSLLCKNLLNGLGDLCKIAAATMRMLGWARAASRGKCPLLYLSAANIVVYFMFAHILQLPSSDHDLQDAKFVPAFAGRAFLLPW